MRERKSQDKKSAQKTSGFLGFPASAAPNSLADITIIGIPEATGYRKGHASHSSNAPAALRTAIAGYGAELDHYDFDLGGPLLGNAGITVIDRGDLSTAPSTPELNRKRITTAIKEILNSGAVPIVLGGDDSVPIPVFSAYEGRGPFTILQIDAHIDWREEIDGELYGYSSTMRRASEMPWIERILQVGMRGVGSARPSEFADALAWGAKIITASEVHQHGIEQVLELIPEGCKCLVTFDCDALDPSIMPAVMAPAPGGLAYLQVTQLIKRVSWKAQICGFNLVELAPERDHNGLGSLTAARIICNVIGTLARSRK
jgi:agmatinase